MKMLLILMVYLLNAFPLFANQEFIPETDINSQIIDSTNSLSPSYKLSLEKILLSHQNLTKHRIFIFIDPKNNLNSQLESQFNYPISEFTISTQDQSIKLLSNYIFESQLTSDQKARIDELFELPLRSSQELDTQLSLRILNFLEMIDSPLFLENTKNSLLDQLQINLVKTQSISPIAITLGLSFSLLLILFVYVILTRVEIHYSADGKKRMGSFFQFIQDIRMRPDPTLKGVKGEW